MLVQGLRDRVFVRLQDGLDGPNNGSSQSDTKPLRHASKITAEDSHIDWTRWTAEEIVRRNRVLGPLWNIATIVPQSSNLPNTTQPPPKRIIFNGIRLGKGTTESSGAEPTLITSYSENPELHLNTCDGRTVTISRAKIEGRVEMDAVKAVERLGGGSFGKLLCL